MSLTSDSNDPRLTHGIDPQPVPQAEVYLVLSEEERAKGFVRPVRRSYRHLGRMGTYETGHGDVTQRRGGCQAVTTMGIGLAETYARDPKFYGATYCVFCSKHLAVSEFVWDGTEEEVGS